MPLCDSSEAYARAVWSKPSPADLPSGWTAGVSEVSRFSCMKFLGVSGVFDYAGPNRNSRYRSCPCCLPRITKSSASGFTVFGADCPPHLYPCLRFVAYLAIGLTQNSGPSGSLLLSREDSSSSTSCRFIPAHRNRLFTAARTSHLNDKRSISILIPRARLLRGQSWWHDRQESCSRTVPRARAEA
jgi:hypothetical protein